MKNTLIIIGLAALLAGCATRTTTVVGSDGQSVTDTTTSIDAVVVAPIVVAPAPVVIAPRPVYVAPRPVYVAPRPPVNHCPPGRPYC